MDPLTILMWTGIVIGGLIALILAIYILFHLVVFGGIVLAFTITFVSAIFSDRKAKKARRGARGF